MWQLGLGNGLLLAKNNESCATVIDAGFNNVTCIWSEQVWWPEPMGYVTDLWARRFMLLTRLAWMG